MTTLADDLTLQTNISEDLTSFIGTQRGRLDHLGPEIGDFIDVAADFVAGGKRLRPAFCYAGWCAGGGDPQDRRIAWAAASFEWLQASALVHDDLMDGSDTRRGKPSMHRRFEAQHRENGLQGSAGQFGMGAAILLGDLLLSWADEMFHTSGFDQATIARAYPYLDACKTEVVAGQFLDVVGQTKAETTVADAMRIVRFKSAKYTVERPLHVGAALAGATPDTIAALTEFGLPLGEAYQLRDDILGVFGDPAVTGKPAGDDVREGKRTVLIARTHELANAEGRMLLQRGLGNGDHIGELSMLIKDSGALDAVEQQIAELEAAAEAALPAIVDEAARNRLYGLILRSTRRSR